MTDFIFHKRPVVSSVFVSVIFDDFVFRSVVGVLGYFTGELGVIRIDTCVDYGNCHTSSTIVFFPSIADIYVVEV